MARRKRSTTKKTTKAVNQKKAFLYREIGVILAVAAGVFLLLTDLGFMGGAGEAIRGVEKGLFGQAYIVFALFLVALALLMYFERGEYLAKFKILSLVIAFVSLTAIFDLMFAGEYDYSLTSYYLSQSQGASGGGALGGAVASGLRSIVGYVGAYFFLIVVLVIACVVISEKSLVSAARSGAERTIRASQARREERKKLRDVPRAIDLSNPPEDETESEMYLRYGREIIESSRPTASDMAQVKAPLRRRSYLPSAAPDIAETGVLGPVGLEENITPVRVRELDYDSDLVPFVETGEDKYRSYSGLLSGDLSTGSAGKAGFAAGRAEGPLVHDYEPPVPEPEEPGTEPEPVPASFPEPAPEPAPEPVPSEPVPLGAEAKGSRPYAFPSTKLLSRGGKAYAEGRDQVLDNAARLEQVLKDFGVGVTVTNIIRGPRVSRYELIPDTGVKVSRITALEGDIKLALAASELRIEAPVPGKSAVGIEVPNSDFRTVRFRDIAESDEFRQASSPLSWGLGLDIQGLPVIADISRMPHVLVAGTTGSGKSVGINTLIMSVLYKSTPDEVRLILIDPKVVELSVYNGIPHLLTEVVTKPDRALSALNWAVAEMNKRYRLFNESSTRNITGYNDKIERTLSALPEDYEGERPSPLPLILIIIDELSELMMHAKKDVEQAIVSLSQLARAAGIHLVVATQRPSVDVVTGLIKSNIPSRVAYRLPSAVDSRTILDQGGAETLLGNGDMLYKPGDKNAPERVQGAFLTDEEIEKVVAFVKKKNEPKGDAHTVDEDLNTQMEFDFSGFDMPARSDEPERDEYFGPAGRLIIQSGKASIGALQRKFKVGFNRAARIMDQLHEAGVVSDSEGTKERRILMSAEEFEEYLRGE